MDQNIIKYPATIKKYSNMDKKIAPLQITNHKFGLLTS
jgi:hypothetical protein